MQHNGCDEIQLLISRFVDNEVSPSERARVEQHVVTCDTCAYKLIEYMEMAVLFSETPLQQPDPALRSSLFREIGTQKEEAQRKDADFVKRGERPWFIPPTPDKAGRPAPSSAFVGRLLGAASPLAMAAVAIFVFLGALALGGRLSPQPKIDTELKEIHLPHVPIPTFDAPIADNSGNGDVPPPVITKVGAANASPAAPSSSYVNATATLGRDAFVKLAQPTPVLEAGDASDKSSWHVLRDAAYGYTISYPPNWWTRVVGSTRYFYPWTSGGTRFAPYWVEMSVYPNEQHLTAKSGNSAICDGRCASVKSETGETVWLRRTISDADNYYDEGYIFDEAYVYKLRVSVPRGVEGLAGFQERMADVQSIRGVMSGRLLLAGEQSAGSSAYGCVLFLSGSDLWMANLSGADSFKLTHDLHVQQFAESPDLARVALAVASNEDNKDPWATSVYLTHISSNGPMLSTLLRSGMDIHDLAWYSDRELLVLAQSKEQGLGIYKLSLPTEKGSTASDTQPRPELMISLPGTLQGAKSLAVSPDRQLITFLGPVGDKQGTDLYAVRPDGSDLVMLVSHAYPLSPLLSGAPVLASENQAIKSYLWADGHLEPGGYSASLLFTSGNSDSPSWNLGGFLYSAASSAKGPMVDPFDLVQFEPERMQITHIAYSPTGKVAMTGYRKDYNNRADQLAGFWTGDFVNGTLPNPVSQPMPSAPNGVTDLEWSPDGKSLIYREMMPFNANTPSSRYDGHSNFRMVKLDLNSGKTTTLYDGVKQ